MFELCYTEIVEKIEGTAWVIYALGEGPKFNISFPINVKSN